MSYVPPHKRHSRGRSTHQIPAPEKLAPLFEKKLNLGPNRPNIDRTGYIVYGDKAVSRWFAVGLQIEDDDDDDDDDGRFPPSVGLRPVTVEALERQGKKPMALVNSCFLDDGGRVSQEGLKKPWMCIAERVMQDLLPSFEYIRSKIETETLEDVKPSLVARVGKVLFLGNNYNKPMEESREDLVSEKCLRQMNRMFYTNVPSSYSENIVNTVVPKTNFKFDGVKDVYHVKLSDKSRPDATISCKCRIMNEENSLELFKMELNQIRQMVCDISCLDTNLDLRVMLCSKRYLTALPDEEEEMINNLIKSAIIDPNVKGGLKWPLGKESCGDRYRVVGVWHTNHKSFSSPFMKLKVRDADRFDFRTSVGEVSKEITVKLKGISSKLMEKKFEDAAVSDMLADAVKLLWEKFLHTSAS